MQRPAILKERVVILGDAPRARRLRCVSDSGSGSGAWLRASVPGTRSSASYCATKSCGVSEPSRATWASSRTVSWLRSLWTRKRSTHSHSEVASEPGNARAGMLLMVLGCLVSSLVCSAGTYYQVPCAAKRGAGTHPLGLLASSPDLSFVEVGVCVLLVVCRVWRMCAACCERTLCRKRAACHLSSLSCAS